MSIQEKYMTIALQEKILISNLKLLSAILIFKIFYVNAWKGNYKQYIIILIVLPP